MAGIVARYDMTHSRLILGALAVAAAIGMATPASALPATWTGPYSLTVDPLDFTAGTGTLAPGHPSLNLTGSSVGNHSIAFAGPVTVTLNTIPATIPQNLIVFC